MKKKLTMAERQHLLLEMLKTVDSICKEHGLKYMLSYGTLLGAIRHKGFIPWDDDVDINMPLDDIEKLKTYLDPTQLKICDVMSDPLYAFPFPRLAYVPTYRKIGLVCEEYGLNIDVYPFFPCAETKEEVETFFEKGNVLRRKRQRMENLRRKLLHVLPISNIPGYTACMRDYREYCINTIRREKSTHYFCFGGPFRWYQWFDFDLFEEQITVEFEGERFMAPARYHDYLTHIYGDYMTPPPVEKRVPYHKETFYWK